SDGFVAVIVSFKRGVAQALVTRAIEPEPAEAGLACADVPAEHDVAIAFAGRGLNGIEPAIKALRRRGEYGCHSRAELNDPHGSIGALSTSKAACPCLNQNIFLVG